MSCRGADIKGALATWQPMHTFYRPSLGLRSVIGLPGASFDWLEVRTLKISGEPWNAAVVA
jgi:hypothetical protein